MGGEDCRIERFIFPDGESVEVMVFDHGRASGAAGHAPATPAPASAPAPGATGATAAGPSPSRPAPATAAPPPCCAPPPPRQEEAHKCPVCGSELVYPIDWDRTGAASWTLVLRCPECETRREVTLGRASVEQLNRELYFGARELARDADQLTRRNFEEEADRIVAALERDLILPMDF